MRIELSWPAPALWPNRKADWRAKAPFTRAARDEAYMLTKSALNGAAWDDDGNIITVKVTGHKPAEHGQDRDGFTSALKPAFDGIASALGVNDRRFLHVVDWGEPMPPKGGVTVEIDP